MRTHPCALINIPHFVWDLQPNARSAGAYSGAGGPAQHRTHRIESQRVSIWSHEQHNLQGKGWFTWEHNLTHMSVEERCSTLCWDGYFVFTWTLAFWCLPLIRHVMSLPLVDTLRKTGKERRRMLRKAEGSKRVTEWK